MKNFNVYATTTFGSEDRTYFVGFRMDGDDGACSVLEQSEQKIPAYMLIHLMNKMHEECGLMFPDTLPSVRGVMSVVSGGSHPALNVDGKQYCLDDLVDGSWIGNLDVLAMAKYVRDLPKQTLSPMFWREWTDDNVIANNVYVNRTEGYELLDVKNASEWKISCRK